MTSCPIDARIKPALGDGRVKFRAICSKMAQYNFAQSGMNAAAYRRLLGDEQRTV